MVERPIGHLTKDFHDKLLDKVYSNPEISEEIEKLKELILSCCHETTYIKYPAKSHTRAVILGGYFSKQGLHTHVNRTTFEVTLVWFVE